MKVYTAGKIWHAPKFQELRDVYGYDVNCRWIDMDDKNPIVKRRKDILWQICFEDVRDCDFVLLYCEDMSEEQRGALVEIGMAYAFGKPVYAVGTCRTIQANAIADVAFTHFEGFHWLPETDLLKGFRMAEKMFLKQRKALRLSA